MAAASAAKPSDRGLPSSLAAAAAAAAAGGSATGRGAACAAAAGGWVGGASLPPGGSCGRRRVVPASGAAATVPNGSEGVLAAAGAPSARNVGAGTAAAAPRGWREGEKMRATGRSENAARAAAAPPRRDKSARAESSKGKGEEGGRAQQRHPAPGIWPQPRRQRMHHRATGAARWDAEGEGAVERRRMQASKRCFGRWPSAIRRRPAKSDQKITDAARRQRGRHSDGVPVGDDRQRCADGS